MTTPYKESVHRRFLVTLFTLRANRHMQTLATTYGWNAETLHAHCEKLITPQRMSAAATAAITATS